MTTSLGPSLDTPAYRALRSRFQPLLEQIAAGALARERAGELPAEPMEALKRTGFGALRVPEPYGGGGVDLVELTALWIDLAAADSNLSQALRGHFALAEDRAWQHARGMDQKVWFDRFVAGEIAGNAWTEVGATPMGGLNTVAAAADDGYAVTGQKYYTTGSIFAEWADVYARRVTPDGAEDLVIALVDLRHPGASVSDDWDGFGQRGTGSGTTTFDAVPAVEVIPFTDRFPYQTAFYQLNLLATLAGIGRAALTETVGQVRGRSRNYSHANAARVRDDPQVLARVGQVQAKAYAAEATALRVASALQRVFDGAAGSDQEIERLNEAAELESAAAQVVVTDLVLDATTVLFDTLGASATSVSLGLDRHWRNARTVASHNPRILKERVVGDFLVNGTPPPYAWAIGTTVREAGGGASRDAASTRGERPCLSPPRPKHA
ncbi:acyl-CoA dehydrogenase family protein [Nocardioides cheoyonin]|uniref:acyl-CoA dehydrogenase family protein n=1 Tax=Nocardioides cheoyonin TaxID=3156615 RepID=UPI0032B5DE52